jgi:hypothetical protein
VTFKVPYILKQQKNPKKIEKRIRTRIIENAKQLQKKPDNLGKLINKNQNIKQTAIIFIGQRSKEWDDFSEML